MARMEKAAHLQVFFTYQIPHKKFSDIKKFIPSLKSRRKGMSLHVPQKGASMEIDAHFQSLT
jgi:hypothetical protein